MYPGARFGRRYFIQDIPFRRVPRKQAALADGDGSWRAAVVARARGCVCRVSVTSRQRTPAGVRCVLSIRVIRENRHYRADNGRRDAG